MQRFMSGLLFIVLCLCALPVLAQQAATVRIPMLVQHDAWTARCEDDAKVPGAQGFGMGYSGLNRNFTPGHRYRVSGSLGWSFLLTIDADGTPSVSEIAAGPYLAKAPAIRVNTADPEMKNPVEVFFGPVREFAVTVPVDYLGWQISGAYGLRSGNRLVELPDGKWEMQGALGWSVPLTVENGALKLNGAPAGLPANAVKVTATGVTLAPPAKTNRVTINVPALLGNYAVQTADGKPLLPAMAGPQTANLPTGMYKLAGSGWTAELAVADGACEAKLPEAKLAGIVNWPGGLTAARPGPFTVNAPWGPATVQVPDDPNGPASIGIGWSEDRANGLSVTVTSKDGKWQIKPQFIRGGGKDWVINVFITANDLATPPFPAGLPGGPAGPDTNPEALISNVAIPTNQPSGAYSITVKAIPPGEAADSKKIISASAVAIVNGTLATSIWFAVNRTTYRTDEPIELCAWQAGDKERNTPLELAASNAQGKRLVLGTLRAQNGLFRIPAGMLSPGQYAIQLLNADKVVATRDLLIVADMRPSNFPIHAYGTILNQTQAVDKLNELGVNTFLDQGGIWLENESRAGAQAGGLADLAQLLPAVGPAARYSPQGNHFMDYLDKVNWRFFAQWGSAHQPYGYGITFADPTVVERLTMTSLWASQYMRQHPGFLGMNVFDEGGTPRGPHFYEDASFLEYEAFAKKFGRAKPNYYGEDNEAGRAWIYDKQEQHNICYSGIGKRLEDINAFADPGAHLYLGTQNGNLNSMAVDGGHPPLAYQAITLSTFHWYPGYINTAFILLGNEYHFMQPKPIEFWPLIWADGHIDLTKHEVNLAVSRQVDGVGHFHWPGMLTGAKEEEFTALHARLTEYGDLFRTVRRDRPSEVAVLYSLYDFAPKLIPEKGNLWSAYNNAYRAAYTGYLAISALLRKGIGAGWVCEEEILQRNGLAGRKILILPGITSMQPELQKKLADFIAAGGTVFADAATTVNIPGMKRLEVDFGAMVDQAKYTQKGEDGKESSMNIDRVVLDKVLPALAPVEQLVGQHLQPGVIDLLVTEQRQGKGRYYFCLNDRVIPLDKMPAPLSEYRVQKYFMPIDTTVTLPGTGVVYDVFAGKEVARANGTATVPVKLSEGDMALFAVLPDAVGRIGIMTANPARAGQPLPLTVRVFGAGGGLLDAAIPLEIILLDNAGKAIRPVMYRSTRNGVYTDKIFIGAFDPAQITIRVRELLSGMKLETVVKVDAPLQVAGEVKDPVIVENGAALKRFMSTQKTVMVVLGDGAGAPDEKAIEPLLRALRARKVDVEVRRASEIDRKTFDNYVGRGLARMSYPPFPGSESVPEVDKPVIAIGNSTNNRLIRIVTQDRNWTRYADRGFPGPGRGYAVHVWQPFSLTDDAVLAIAEDDAGLKRVVDWLAKQVK